MMFDLLIFFILLAVLWIVYDKSTHSQKGLPPGPLKIPILGNFIQVALAAESGSTPPATLMKLAKRYGDIMYLDMGAIKGVLVSSRDACLEALSHDKLVGRKIGGVFGERCNGKPVGLILLGRDYLVMRKFVTNVMKSYGFGKASTMEECALDERSDFVHYIDNLLPTDTNKKVFAMKNFFGLTTINNTWSYITGKKFVADDPRIKRLGHLSEQFLRSCNFGSDITMSFPLLRKLFPVWSGKVKQLECMNKILDFIRETIAEHRAREDFAENPLSFVDAYLKEISNGTKEGGYIFDDDQLTSLLLDLFNAGADTLKQTLTFSVLYLIVNPEVQRKAQKEIDTVAPNGVPITMDMKNSMPYTNATILETLRLASFVPVSPRMALEDFKLRGYRIPKGTTVIVNMYAVHYDEKVWGDPLVFRPERYLDSEGKIDQSVVSKLIIFGAGAHSCIGRKLAETLLFLYVSTLLQRFTFRIPEGQPVPSTEHLAGIVTQPKPFDAEIERRISN